FMVELPVRSVSTVPAESLTGIAPAQSTRSEEHTSELQSLTNLVCRLLLEKKKKTHHSEECSEHTKPDTRPTSQIESQHAIEGTSTTDTTAADLRLTHATR